MSRRAKGIVLAAAMIGALMTGCAASPEQDAGDARHGPPPAAPTDPQAGRALAIVATVPSWTDTAYGPTHVAALLEAARRLEALPLDAVRQAVAHLCDGRGEPTYTLDDPSRVYVLLRVLFAVPPTIDRSRAKVFGGWLGHPSISSESAGFALAWPLRIDADRIVGVERGFGYLGAPYDGAGEFDYFRSLFPRRKLAR